MSNSGQRVSKSKEDNASYLGYLIMLYFHRITHTRDAIRNTRKEKDE